MCQITTGGVQVRMGGNWASGGTYSGQSCSGAGGPSSASGECISYGGKTACTGTDGCVTINGDKVCTNGINPATCQGYASGAVACSSSGGSAPASPPAPGAPGGGAATPDATVGGGSSSAPSSSWASYYSSSTVASSPSGVVSSAPGSSGNGSGPASSAPDDCGVNDCSGSIPTLPNEDTIETTTQNAASAIQNAPIVAAISGIAGAVPSGQCPTSEFVVFGKTYTLDAQCQLWTQVAPVVQLVMLAVWAFIGIRIIMGP